MKAVARLRTPGRGGAVIYRKVEEEIDTSLSSISLLVLSDLPDRVTELKEKDQRGWRRGGILNL